MKILIAEDDNALMKTISGYLESVGLQVITTNNGREAIELIDNHKPDLVVTDIVMPYTSGLELIGIVKSKNVRKIPIIVLSSIDEEDTVMIAFKLGADDFITKPFELPELTLRINRLLNLNQKVA